MDHQTQIRQAIIEVLACQPGLTARQIARRLSGIDSRAVDKRNVNSILYQTLDVFTYEGDPAMEAPTWSLVPARTGEPWAACLLTEEEEPPGAATRRAPIGIDPLYAWQEDALEAWKSNDSCGVVEAVTGAGKSRVALAAMRDVFGRGGKVLVLVPTKELQSQWFELVRKTWPGVTIGSLGNGSRDDLASCDVLVAIVNSARTGGISVPHNSLLIADECHRYGSVANQEALDPHFTSRLGLSATYERNDGGCAEYLTPYFGEVCFRLGYERALGEDAIAHFSVTLIGVQFSALERREYDELSQQCKQLRLKLLNGYGIPAEPFGDFMQAVVELSKESFSAGARTASQYLRAFSERRQLLAETHAKLAVLRDIATAIQRADRTIVFNQTIAGAERACEALEALGLQGRSIHSGLVPKDRDRVFEEFRSGTVTVITAAQVLDEGINVPEADLAIILAATKTRRQMVQRMGRVLRRKKDGRIARFAIVYVEGTSEDPRDGAYEAFLSDVTNLADAVATFPSSAPASDASEFLCELTIIGAQRAAARAAILFPPLSDATRASTVPQATSADVRHGPKETTPEADFAPVGPTAPPVPRIPLWKSEPSVCSAIELLSDWVKPLTSFQATELRGRLGAAWKRYRGRLKTADPADVAQLNESAMECEKALRRVEELAPPSPSAGLASGHQPLKKPQLVSSPDGVEPKHQSIVEGDGHQRRDEAEDPHGDTSGGFRGAPNQFRPAQIAIRGAPCQYCRAVVVFVPDTPALGANSPLWRMCANGPGNSPERLHACAMIPNGVPPAPVQSLPRSVWDEIMRLRVRRCSDIPVVPVPPSSPQSTERARAAEVEHGSTARTLSNEALRKAAVISDSSRPLNVSTTPRDLDWGTCAACGVRIGWRSAYDLCARCGAD